MKNRVYSENIANAINEFLTNDGWHYSFDEQKGLFDFGLNIKGKIKKIRYIVDIKDDAYLVYAVAPIGADEDDKGMMTEMAKFVCRANYGLKNGNFEFDMDDGEIRFKCYVDCDGINPTTEMIKSSIYCPATMFDRYGDGIVGIIFGGMSGKEAVEHCEKSTEEELRSLLNELTDSYGDGEHSGVLARLTEHFVASNDEEAETTTTSEESVHIKTNLFNTKGVNA